ncbi:MAG: dihydroneopterin aldolase [Candidatus Melainabacteria bacterium RIFCSPLOWO2_02_FULL_35_15]|nr:MAG: dihydroneopterin aldolase [Candidatus Melainabacteria bacterium RIFCSPLOWO2_12_FULL_35_11]OGI14112.1 MAG: dihydroneopterin aldolase [Candidatus Melainabacteria bacterium RIFCSPLOWO2_02_FULL_35_15]
MTKININDIPCYCSIGIASEEKKMGQQLIVDVTVEIDSEKVSKTDSVSDTVSYVDVYDIVQKVGQSQSFSVIEFLAEKIASDILQLSLIISAKVKVHKPHIPYKCFRGNVSVEVERRK